MLTADQILQGRYRIIRQLGHGGMGAVYEAKDERLGSSVALKEILLDLDNSDQQEIVRRAFEREAKILANLYHEAFPRVTDYFSEKDRQFLVMELIYGDDLGELLGKNKTPFASADILKWTEQLLDALDYLHTQTPPIIHRDIKPQNLKLTSRGKMKLLDFGIAKGADGISSNTATNQTFIAASVNYSPIEQMFHVLHPSVCAMIVEKHSAKSDQLMKQTAAARSDIYSLGATLYNLSTGVTPIDSLKRAIAVWSGEIDPLPRPNELNPNISKTLSDILLKAMAVDYENRFASAAEMQTALHQTSFIPQTIFQTDPDEQQIASERNTAVLNFAPPDTLIEPSIATAFVKPKTTVKSGNTIILWGVLALSILLISVGGIGAYFAVNFIPNDPTPESTPFGAANSPTAISSTTPTTRPTEKISPTMPEKTVSPKTVIEPTEKPTIKPQDIVTPRPTATKKPATPKPKRKKNLDCIFNDDCG